MAFDQPRPEFNPYTVDEIRDERRLQSSFGQGLLNLLMYDEQLLNSILQLQSNIFNSITTQIEKDEIANLVNGFKD